MCRLTSNFNPLSNFGPQLDAMTTNQLDHLPGRTLFLNGEEWLYFSGTGYLGMGHDADFQQLLQEGIARYGIHFGGSRLSNLRLNIFEETERFLANYTGTQAAMVVSSGSLAGQLLVKWLREWGELHLAPGTHPALWDNQAPIQQTWQDWTQYILQEAAQKKGRMVILANSIDPLQVQQFDFSWLQYLSPNRETILVIDDSHGFGVTGVNGAGILSLIRAPAQVPTLAISSLGKAFGIPGGAIFGPQSIIDKLWQSPYFGGASPAPPAFLHAFLQAQPLYHQHRQQLQANIQQFVADLQSPIEMRKIVDYPLFYIPDQAIAAFLSSERVLISSFAYPTPTDPTITRVVLNSGHHSSDINRLTFLLNTYFFAQKP
jgi:7-keto-8-aminopelargonate synthetase-like enzyme